VQAELLAAPQAGEPTIVLTDASLGWEAGRLRKTTLHDISFEVRGVAFAHVQLADAANGDSATACCDCAS